MKKTGILSPTNKKKTSTVNTTQSVPRAKTIKNPANKKKDFNRKYNTKCTASKNN